jgi:hypothetical protein
MNFSSFWSDLLAGLLGSGAGIVIGLQVDRVRTRKHERARDERLVQNLIDRLAGKRAFSHAADIGEVEDEADRERCNLSVVDARERILVVCDEIAQREDIISPLRKMERDTMAYLSFVEREKPKYAMALIQLRDRLFEQETDLRRLMPGLRVEPPGSRDGNKPAWLP